MVTACRYYEYHSTIHWKYEPGWSGGIGWLISVFTSALLAHMDSSRTVSVFKLGVQVVVSVFIFLFFFLCTQNSKRTNKHLIWVFRELVVLLNNLEEWRNVDTMSDCMIHHELDQTNLYFLFWFFEPWAIHVPIQQYCHWLLNLYYIFFLPLEALTRSGVVCMSN